MAVAFLVFNVLIFCSFLSAFLLGLIQFINQEEVNNCEMTYMYEIPQYIPVQLNRSLRARFPAYNLYVYGEGHYADGLREKFRGIPVLFLPGNSGSFKQVRSLASVALKKASNSGSPVHFNYFSIDFNEELSAFYGNVLFRQVEYAAICVESILKLYNGQSNPPTSVLVVGHSMGGVVARALMTLPHFDSKMINVILTLATPHLAPVAKPDLDMEQFYDNMNYYWSKWNRNATLGHISLVSIGGGHRDLMVRSDLVHMPAPAVDSDRDMTMVSTSIPGVWTSTDHLCIVWCKQLVLAIVRATFQLVDQTTQQIAFNVTRRAAILRDNFVFGVGRAHKLSLPEGGASFVADKSWERFGPGKKIYSSNSKKIHSSSLLLPLKRDQDSVTLAMGFDMEPWIFGCDNPQLLPATNGSADRITLCRVEGTLPQKSTYLPIGRTFWKMFLCGKDCRQNKSHLMIKLPSEQNDVSVISETFVLSERSKNVTLLDTVGSSAFFTVPDNSLFFQLVFTDLEEIWPSFIATVRASGSKCPAHAGVSHFHVPWSKEDVFTTIKTNSLNEHSIRIFARKNYEISKSDDFPKLRLYLHPDCSIKIDIKFSPLKSLEQVVRFNLALLPAYLAASLLQLLSNQLGSLSDSVHCFSIWRFLSLWDSVWMLVKVRFLVAVFGMAFQYSSSFPFDASALFPDDITSLSSFLISVFLQASCTTILALGAVLVSFCMLLFGKLLAMILDWFRLKENQAKASGSFLSIFASIGISALILYIGCQTCGSVSLLALQIISVLKLFHCHVQLWRTGSAREHTSKVTGCRLNVSLYLFWAMIFLLNCPALIFWIKNLKFQNRLIPDPSFFPAIFSILAFFGQTDPSSVHRKEYYHTLSSVQHWVSIGILATSLQRIYLTGWLLVVDAILLSAWHPLIELFFGGDGGEEMSTAAAAHQKDKPTRPIRRQGRKDVHKD